MLTTDEQRLLLSLAIAILHTAENNLFTALRIEYATRHWKSDDVDFPIEIEIPRKAFVYDRRWLIVIRKEKKS